MASTSPRKGADTDQPDVREERDGTPASSEDVLVETVMLVAIGASAGGLVPLKELIASLPDNSGMAFVIVQHLAPSSPSLLSELLAAKTRMPVLQVNEDTTVDRNHVYVIAPNTFLIFRGSKLCVEPPPEHPRIRLPVDRLFKSLAEEIGSAAVGIVLSGTGSDGTLGISAIRGAGGLTIAQEPPTAEYDDMPRHAIATGLVDLVLPVSQMAQILMKNLATPLLQKPTKPERDGKQSDTGSLNAVLDVVGKQSRTDFRWYRRSTLLRRVARRMGIVGMEDLEDYTRLLNEDANEVTELVRDLLIGVTRFFRDPEAYTELDRMVIRPLIRDKDLETPVRVWTAGCGSGEEVYSIAMLLFEAIEAAGKSVKVQIFATDIDEHSLQTAREGIYPLGIADDISSERLERFFVRLKNGYQVRKLLRDAVVFTAHNLVADPPFCHMDLVSCRNLLIYVEPEMQKKIIALFHFALSRKHGYLFLGKSESTANQPELFEPVSTDPRILRRQVPPRRVEIELPVYAKIGALPQPKNECSQRDPYALDDILKSVLLSHFGAAVVLIDESGRIMRFLGRLDRYLSISSGDPELNLLDMAREGLAASLWPAVRDAINTREAQVISRIPVKQDNDVLPADVTILPVASPDTSGGLVTVVLERSRDLTPGTGEGADDSAIVRLERELHLTQEDLRCTIAELQSASQELKVANEEATSMNEEMQSTNEELETSKEELQSINEELSSVNSELKDKLAELNAANNDMSNLLNSTAIATIFLDNELSIRFFTPLAGELLNLRPADKGRPIAHFAHKLLDLNLHDEAARIQAGTESIRRELRSPDGRWLLMHLLAYGNGDGHDDGVVVTFTDVSELKLAEEKSRRLAAVMTASTDAVLLINTKGKIQDWNRGAERMYGWASEEAVGKTLFDLTPADSAESAKELLATLNCGEGVHSFETQRVCKDGRIMDVWLTVSSLSPSADAPVIALTERDLTERKQQMRLLQERADQLQRLTSEVILAEQRERRRLASVLHDHLNSCWWARSSASMSSLARSMKRPRRPSRRSTT